MHLKVKGVATLLMNLSGFHGSGLIGLVCPLANPAIMRLGGWAVCIKGGRTEKFDTVKCFERAST